jgi:sulfane dehydrogenase subunit SoxC
MPRRARSEPERIAGGGLLHRRAFLAGALLVPGALATRGASAEGLADAGWSRQPGAAPSGYGAPAPQESGVVREIYTDTPGIAPGAGVSFTPLHRLRGRITPAGLHFERHHAGVPAVDPEQHRLVIHGLVREPLSFSVNDLLRYPLVSRFHFLECSGNSLVNALPEPQQLPCGVIHGLLSCSEWTGIPLGVLLDEAGVAADAQWGIAEGADAARMNRSIPLAKLREDALVALYQNGERLRPEQGYPLRLFLPGWEGNTSVKWLRRIELARAPVHSREETSRYTDLLASGRAEQFTFEMGVKSVITHPSPGAELGPPGVYEISGLAWSGAGRVARVELSADGGASWAEAELEAPVLPRCLARFRIAWRWDGGPALLASRATDETGASQPERDAWRARYSPGGEKYHYNAVQRWRIEAGGGVKNVYA